MLKQKRPPDPVHVPGMERGEEFVLHKGHEPGRNGAKHQYRTARDSTSIAADQREPIDPRMPEIPPA
jgi:hypothetical protein